MSAGVGSRIAHYRLVEKIGEGGMGIVWKAHDLKLDRTVAIKLLPDDFAGEPDLRARFEREAKAIASLNHPNIVTIYSVEEADGALFFTMELVDGEPLTTRIVPGGLALEPFLDLAIPLADAIAAAHERGIIHRDLKPSNVMVSRSGKVKILDFGLARFLPPGRSFAPDADATATTLAGSEISGTIRYMSPEVLRGEPVDHCADIFSLGFILFELATGGPPFMGRTAPEAVAAILKDEPRSALHLNPRMPRQLDRILRRCLEKDTRRRVQSALDLRNELEQLRQDQTLPEAEFDRSIAVLPFSDMSPDKDQAYFCEGMAEEIINALTRIPGLRVASRTTAFQFRETAMDSREIGRRLNVGTLLEGSVRKSGARLRITVQLIEAERGFHLWSESYDRELKDVFEVQEEIARSVAGALQIRLSPDEKGPLLKAPTRHVQAYDYYLRARKFYYQYAKRDVEFALQLFSRAIELDPGYALAYAGLADCWSFLYLYAERKPAIRSQAESASLRAVELAPDSAQAHASRGLALSLGGGRDDAERAFETATRLDPGLFEGWYFYARHCFALGDRERAIRLYEQAGRVRPEDYYSRLLVAQIYDDLGWTEKARAARREGIALAEEHLELNPDDARALYMAANGFVCLGETARAIEWARRARAIAPEESMVLYNLGCIYAIAGEVEEALDCLERAVANGLSQKGWFLHDSNLDALRAHPRFQALMARVE